eukprot:gene29653-36731_t
MDENHKSANAMPALMYDLLAADGAEEFYTTENNAARLETVDEARELDRNTIKAWDGHPNFHVIPNGSGGFQEKLEKVTKIIVDYVKSEDVQDNSEV